MMKNKLLILLCGITLFACTKKESAEPENLTTDLIEMVVQVSGKGMTALDTTGKVLWVYEPSDKLTYGTQPRFSDGKIFFSFFSPSTQIQEIHVVDSKSGLVSEIIEPAKVSNWNIRRFQNFHVDNDVMIFVDETGINSYNIMTKVAVNIEKNNKLFGSAEIAVNDGKYYFKKIEYTDAFGEDLKMTFVCGDFATNKILWTKSMSEPDVVKRIGYKIPVISNDKVFVEDVRGLSVYDSNNGSPLFRYPTQYAGPYGYQVVNDTIFLTKGFDIMALNATKVEEIWKTGLRNTTGGPAQVYKDGVFNGRQPIIKYAKKDGKELWETSTQENIGSDMVAGGNTLYAMGSSTLYAINTESGKVKWQYKKSTSDRYFSPFIIRKDGKAIFSK